MNSSDYGFYTPRRIRFLLSRYWMLEQGYLPRFSEEEASGQWLAQVLRKRGAVSGAAFEYVAIVKADLDRALSQLEPKQQIAIRKLLIERTEQSAPNIGVIARQLGLTPREVYYRVHEGTEKMASLLADRPVPKVVGWEMAAPDLIAVTRH